MRHALALSLLLVAGLARPGFTAGQYLEAGQNGFALNGALGFGEEETAFGAGLAYSFGGAFDIVGSYARVNVETEAPKVEFGGNNFAVGVMIHPLKESHRMPVGLSLEAGYLHATYGGGDLEKADIEGSANGFATGATLHKTFDLNSKFAVLAGAGYGWSYVSVEIGDRSDSQGASSFPLSLEGIFSLAENGKLVVGPSFSFGEDTNVFGINLALIRAL